MNLTRIHFIIYLFAITLVFSGCETQKGLSVTDLRVEYLKEPIGIDTKKPNFGWKIESQEDSIFQEYVQIRVASEKSKLDVADIWKSQKIKTNNSINLTYQGTELTAGKKYYWQVKIWNNNGNDSEWSNPSSWQMGLLKEDDWNASWISNKFKEVTNKREPLSEIIQREFVKEDTAAVYLRKPFEIKKKIKSAIAFVSGLGYYELYINGDKIGDHIMDPVFTDYQKSVKYTGFDITSNLKKGINIVASILGNGFYNHQEADLFQMEKANWKTPPKFLLQIEIEFEDGKKEIIKSDKSWKWSYGEIVYNSIRGGETLYANKNLDGWNNVGYSEKNWKSVVEVPKPIGELSYQYMEPMRETRTIKPQKIWEIGKDTTVFDFGENITGYVDSNISGKKGKLVIFDFNELLNKDSTVNTENSSGHTWGRFQKGKLILSDKKIDNFKPRFTYHGFRYVQVVGVPKDQIIDMVALSVHTDLGRIGKFESSNKRLNELHAAVNRTLLNSIHGMPGEEPTREKMGWTFDAGMATMESYLMNFEVINAYKKYLDDLISSQEKNGHIPPIVPTNGWGLMEKNEKGIDTTVRYDDPWWGGTIAFVTDKLFQFTNDTTTVKKAYEPIKAYANFVMETSKEDIVYWSLGDWLDMEHNKRGWGPGLTPIEQTSTAASYYLCKIVAKNAKILGYDSDEKEYEVHAERIKKSFNKAFLDKESGWYAKNGQTAQALPLYLGLVPNDMIEKVEQKLIEAIKNNDYHISVGFIGVNPLLKYLSENGYGELVYKLVTQEESPGWLHFVKDHKSTLGENLNAEGYGTSHHPFGANIGFYLYYYLGGIKPDFSKQYDFYLTPGLESGLDCVKTSYNSLKGEVKSDWEKTGDGYKITLSIPPNATGLLRIPKHFEIKNPRFKKTEDSTNGFFSIVIPSGNYNIEIWN